MPRTKILNHVTRETAATWAKLVRLYPKLKNFECPKVTLNGRFTRCAGMCYYQENRIDISIKYFIFNESEIINQTIPHELAHQAQFNLYGMKAMHALGGHGLEWQGIMATMGLEVSRFHNMSIPPISLSEALSIYAEKN